MSSSSRSSLSRNAAFAGLLSCALAAPLAAQSGQWQPSVELLTPRRLLAAAAHDGKIYTFGGCGSPCFAPPLHTSTREEKTVEVYEPRQPDVPQSRDRWSSRRPMPPIVFGAAAAAPGDGKVYLFGGFVTPSSTQAYDPGPGPQADTWEPRAAMPTPRHGLAAVAVEGKVYVIGGSNGTTAVAALEAYDPEHDSWESLPPMPTARVFLAAAAVGRRIYAIGGSPDCCGNGTTNVVEIYDTVQRTWSRGPSLPVAMQTSAAAAFEGKVYVLGGFVPGQGATGATFELDPANLAADWVPQTTMPTPRDQAPAVALDDGIHVLGGATNCHCSPRGDHPVFVPSRIDLAITKTGGPQDVCPGQTVSYTIKVANVGTEPVLGARVDDPAEGGDDRFNEVLPGATWMCEPSGSLGSACRGPDSGVGPIHGLVDLPVGGEVTYELTGTVALGANGSLANRAQVRPPDGVIDEDSTNDRSMVIETAIHRDRLEIHKRELPARDVAAPLDVLLYEITVTNHCHIPLRTTVEDNLSAAGLADPTPGSLRDVVTLPPGGSATFRVSGTVPCDCGAPPEPIRNVATATAPGQDPVQDVDVDTVLGADHRLEVAIDGPGTLALASCSGDYTITVANPGPCPARDVVLEVSAPPELSVVSISPLCSGGGPCYLPPKPASLTAIAHVEVAAGVQCAPVPAPTIRATARTACAPPPAPPAEASKAVVIPCDLAITKSADTAFAAPGDCILYSIDVANHGCGAVCNAVVADAFPTELDSVNWCRGAACTPKIPGNLADVLCLPRGGSETYQVSATLSPLFVGPVLNTATVTLPAGIPDAQPADNTSTDTTAVAPPPGVTALCTGTPDQVTESSDVTFTFVLWNGGPADQADNPGDELVDIVPAGLTLVSAVASSGTISIAPANTVHWNGAIAAGDMVTIEITKNVDVGTAGMTLCEPATVFFDSDGNGSNESIAASDVRCRSCCFTVTELGPIPTLSQLAMAALVLLLAALAVKRLR